MKEYYLAYIINKGITESLPDFDKLMYFVIKKS